MDKCLGRVNIREAKIDIKKHSKPEKITLSRGGVSSLNWGVFTYGGCNLSLTPTGLVSCQPWM